MQSRSGGRLAIRVQQTSDCPDRRFFSDSFRGSQGQRHCYSGPGFLASNQKDLHRLKWQDRGPIDFLTYDDLLSTLVSLATEMRKI